MKGGNCERRDAGCSLIGSIFTTVKYLKNEAYTIGPIQAPLSLVWTSSSLGLRQRCEE